jgi:hypothetical protein
MTTYDFDRQLAEGDRGETFLDAFFRARGHAIRRATLEEQRQGIDRVFTTPEGRVSRVEYKTDYLSAKTGNAFIETVSVDSQGKMGWALTAQADYLIYYIPGRAIYVLPFMSLHWALPRWIRECPAKAAQNRGYATHGVLVPLEEVAGLAVQCFEVNGDDAGGGDG